MLKQIGIGLAAGAVATAAMDRGQSTVIPAVSSWIGSLHGSDSNSNQQSTPPSNEEEPESSPEKVAHRFADYLNVSISRTRVRTLGNRLHWAYGVHWGVPYAVLPLKSGPRSGLLYGAALWLGSDELLLWMIGIARKPTSYPLSTHVKALAAHVIYGIMLGSTVRGLELAFGRSGRSSA